MTARWIHGDGKEVTAPVPASLDIDVGDLMYQNASGEAVPATQLTPAALEEMQTTFATSFLGSSVDQRRSGEAIAGKIRVACGGRHKYPCDALAAQLEIGDLVAIAGEATTETDNTLANQYVEPTADTAKAIGRVARRHLVGETAIEFELFSAVMAPLT